MAVTSISKTCNNNVIFVANDNQNFITDKNLIREVADKGL